MTNARVSLEYRDFRERNVISIAMTVVHVGPLLILPQLVHSHYHLSKRVEDSCNGERR